MRLRGIDVLQRVNDTPAVYTITNTVNGKRYVGSAVRPNNRRMWHLRFLRRGVHPNPHLQRAWNRYGESVFQFDVCEAVSESFWLRAREQAWIHRLGTGDPHRGYNRVVDAFGGLISESSKQLHRQQVIAAMASPEVRGRLSVAQKQRWTHPTSRAESMRAVHSPEACLARSKAASVWLNDPSRNQKHRESVADTLVQQRKGDSLRKTNQQPEVQKTRSLAQVARRAAERAATPPEVLEERLRLKRKAKTERQRRNRADKRRSAHG